MNEFQEALNRLYGGALSYVFNSHMNKDRAKRDYAMDKNKIQELVDRATPKKPIVEIKEIKYKESTFHKHIPHCPICHTRLFLIGSCCYNNDCRQAIDWSKDE